MSYCVHELFSVPVIHLQFNQHHKYTDLPVIKKKDKRPANWTMSVNTSYPNIVKDDDFISLHIANELKLDITHTIATAFKDINISTNFNIFSFWYNIYYEHQGQEPHNHIGNINPYWCGTYYNKNATPTIFYKEQGIRDIHLMPDWNESKLKLSFTPITKIDVKEGDILLFPPYLMHSVPEQEQYRVTFSFNLIRK